MHSNFTISHSVADKLTISISRLDSDFLLDRMISSNDAAKLFITFSIGNTANAVTSAINFRFTKRNIDDLIF